jgi:putative FmdB family regulatory protein
MPIYAYRCAACGHAQDVLQKLSDPLLTLCPSCGASAFEKQVTAAGFQLKGSGWYVTDFRDGNSGAKKDADKGEKAEKGEKAAEGSPPAAKDGDAPAAKAADAAPAPAPAAAAAKSDAAPAASPPPAAPGAGS